MRKRKQCKAETTPMRYIQIYLYTYSNERPLQLVFYNYSNVYSFSHFSSASTITGK